MKMQHRSKLEWLTTIMASALLWSGAVSAQQANPHDHRQFHTTTNSVGVGVGGNGAVRAQLTWETRSDLDLHLDLPNNAGHVFYGNRSQSFNNGGAIAELDRDNLGGVIDVQPNIRAENILVTGDDIPAGDYRFYVRDFSERAGSTDYSLVLTGDGGATTDLADGTLFRTGDQSPHYIVSYAGGSFNQRGTHLTGVDGITPTLPLQPVISQSVIPFSTDNNLRPISTRYNQSQTPLVLGTTQVAYNGNLSNIGSSSVLSGRYDHHSDPYIYFTSDGTTAYPHIRDGAPIRSQIRYGGLVAGGAAGYFRDNPGLILDRSATVIADTGQTGLDVVSIGASGAPLIAPYTGPAAPYVVIGGEIIGAGADGINAAWSTGRGVTNSALGNTNIANDHYQNAAFSGVGAATPIASGGAIKLAAVGIGGVKIVDNLPNSIPNWRSKSIADATNWSGCEQCARNIQGSIGGDIYRIEPKDGLNYLGGYRGVEPGWGYHEVVIKNGRVYDSFGPAGGVELSDYKNLFDYPDAIKFNIKN